MYTSMKDSLEERRERAEAGYTELATHPEALDQLRVDLRMGGWHDASRLESFVTHLGRGASAMLLRCSSCGAHLVCPDA
ncbi:hypothetical protein [Streptomyces sp. NPDC002550]